MSRSIDLAVPATNGAGAAIDSSALGPTKTVVIAGDLGGASVQVQGGTNAGGYVDVLSTSMGGAFVIEGVFEEMRVVVSNAKSAVAATCQVMADSPGSQTAALNDAGAGAGAALDVSSMGAFKTIVCSGAFGGDIIIQLSEDGIDFVDVATLTKPDFVNVNATASQMRIFRSNGNGSPLPHVIASEGSSFAAFTPGSAVLYSPGGAPGRNVFANWVDAVGALEQIAGRKTLALDDSNAAISIPVGAWNMAGVTWTDGRPGGGNVAVTVPEGAELTSLTKIKGDIAISCTANATSPVTLSDGDRIELFDHCSIECSGGVPFWDGSALLGGTSISIVANNAQLNQANSNPVIDTGAASATLEMRNGVALGDQPIQGTGTLAVSWLGMYGGARDLSNFAGVQSNDTRPVWELLRPASVSTNAAGVPQTLHAFNTAAANRTLTLPLAAQNPGAIIGAYNQNGANTVIIATTGGDTISSGSPVAAADLKLWMSDGVSSWLLITAD